MRKPVSIITAVYNGGNLLPMLIDSIRRQDSCDFEFIVVDGGSKDNTVDVIKQNADIIDFWLSEKDKGIYDAWNKGLELASGEWIMFLGCDDQLLPNALEKYMRFLKSNRARVDFISSKVQVIDENGRPVRIKGWEWEWPKFLEEMTVAHPGALHSRDLFVKYGKFNKEYKIVGDYEFLLRPRDKLNAVFMDELTVVTREGGASDSIRAIKEHCRASTITGGYPKLKAYNNAALVATKFLLKKALRKVGINAYLKK